MEIHTPARPQRSTRAAARKKHFTLEHANRTLPLVKRVVADIVRQHKKVSALEDKCHMRRPNVSHDQQERLLRQYNTELDKLRELADELSAIGCDIKDWRRGLVDFRTVHQGREVEFCWCLGEQEIEYWHEINAGFPGRQRIDEAFLSPQSLQAAS